MDWRRLKEDEKLPQRTKECWESQHISWCHNRTAPPRQARQFGGTAFFSINLAAHRACENGQDESGLGRWSWTRYKGKGNQTLCIIVAYQPNPPQGPNTVYAQQNAFFDSIHRDICPRKAFLTNLANYLAKFKEAGDHLVLLIDGNTNMKHSDLVTPFTQLEMRDIIIEKNGTNGPATHKRNSTMSPIDGIWVTPGIVIDSGGYFAYGEVFLNTDNRCLWIDVSFIMAFGHNMAPLCKNQPKRLNCKDPRLVDNYKRLFHQFATPLSLFDRVLNLDKKAMSTIV